MEPPQASSTSRQSSFAESCVSQDTEVPSERELQIGRKLLTDVEGLEEIGDHVHTIRCAPRKRASRTIRRTSRRPTTDSGQEERPRNLHLADRVPAREPRAAARDVGTRVAVEAVHH